MLAHRLGGRQGMTSPFVLYYINFLTVIKGIVAGFSRLYFAPDSIKEFLVGETSTTFTLCIDTMSCHPPWMHDITVPVTGHSAPFWGINFLFIITQLHLWFGCNHSVFLGHCTILILEISYEKKQDFEIFRLYYNFFLIDWCFWKSWKIQKSISK